MEKLEKNTEATLSGALKKQKYHLVGAHSAVKRCKWLYESIVNDRPCYKQKFYGIKSHRCIQMSPSLYYCTQQCLFCWRAQSGDLQVTWDETKIPKVDSPEVNRGRMLQGAGADFDWVQRQPKSELAQIPGSLDRQSRLP